MARQQMLANQHQETKAHVTKTFVNMMFQGKLRQAVRWLTCQEKGGLLSSNNRCTKSGEVVSEVLRSKYPESVEPQLDALQAFPHMLAFMDVNVMASMVEKVARKLSGAAGPDGVDAVTVVDWLLRYDICPGTQPVGIGGILLCLVGKSILFVSMEEVKTACGADQLCSGLWAGIEGGIHTIGL
eukprot:13322013-Ditylum_brightwellii.AAC.1